MAMNLVQHRSDSNVWEHTKWGRRWDTERVALAVTAGVLFAAGLRRRSPAGLMLVLSGGALGWWAAAGSDQRSQYRGRLRDAVPFWPRRADLVVEASEQSFPASDAPSWTSTTASSGAGDTKETRTH